MEVQVSWFAVHAITYFRFNDGSGGAIPVWENVILVNAPDSRTAARMAEEISHHGEGSFGERAEMRGRQGEVVFAGVRKVEAVLQDSQPGHGDEVSYVELTAPDMASVEALARGDAASVVCDDVRDSRPNL